jgi:2-methylcitrate dehydratase PrpD
MDAAFEFANMFSSLRYEDVPPEAVEAAKKETLDSLGVAVAGSGKLGVRELFQIIDKWGGTNESTIISYGTRVPAPNAAQVNATMTHALDFDDDHGSGVVHTGVIVVPTCFAMSEYVGNLSGKEFITAISLGSDFLSRLGLATRAGKSLLEEPVQGGWHLTTLYGYLGAAAVSSKILNLDSGKILNALGIAYHQCAGNFQCVTDGALTKRMGPGFACRGGIVAALMAEKGITGATNIIEGKYGLYAQYFSGDYSRSILLADLGKRFEGVNITIKPYPCCTSTHVFIDAVLNLVNKYDIKPSNVKEVTLIEGAGSYYGVSVPLETKANPRNTIDCQFDAPWSVAVAIARRRVSIEDFTEEAIKSDDILEISNKVRLQLDASLTRTGVEPGIVEIILKSGETYSERVDYARGAPENPFTFNDCVSKFRSCIAYSVKPIAADNIERVIELVKRLEEVDNVSRVIELLCSQ